MLSYESEMAAAYELNAVYDYMNGNSWDNVSQWRPLTDEEFAVYCEVINELGWE
jgi:hypothetical protein